MKKTLLTLLVTFVLCSSGSAFTEVITITNGMTGKLVNINANCNVFNFSCRWYGPLGPGSSGSAVAYSSGGKLLGESGYIYPNDPLYSHGEIGSFYFETVQMYLAAWNCTGEAKLLWE